MRLTLAKRLFRLICGYDLKAYNLCRNSVLQYAVEKDPTKFVRMFRLCHRTEFLVSTSCKSIITAFTHIKQTIFCELLLYYFSIST
jgi:hypothetical protein